MTAPVNEELITLIKELQISNMDKDRSIMMLGDLVSNIINNNVPLDQRWNMGMTIKAYTDKVRSSSPGHVARKDEGFDPIEVNDSGC